MTDRNWVVVADTSAVRIYRQARAGGALEPVEDLQVEIPAQAAFSDRPGRVRERMGRVRHAMEARQTPKQQQEDRVAARIARALAQAVQAPAFERLVLVAPPALLGRIRGQLDAATAVRVIGEQPKDLVRLGPGELHAHLADLLGGSVSSPRIGSAPR